MIIDVNKKLIFINILLLQNLKRWVWEFWSGLVGQQTRIKKKKKKLG